MSDARLPPEVLAFVEAHLESFEKLELVRRLRAVAKISRADAQTLVRLDTDECDLLISQLIESGLIVETGGIIELGERSHDPVFLKLLAIDADDPLAVASAMSATAVKRIRGMAARAFANAFILRGKKNDG